MLQHNCFLRVCCLGNRDTVPVPLCCQENGINDIELFGLLSDTKCDLLFQTYNSNGDGSDTCMQIEMRFLVQIKPAVKYCRYHFANKNDSDAIQRQCWTKVEYREFYQAYHLDIITDSTITNAISDIRKANLIQLLIQNFQHAPKNMNKVLPLQKDGQWPQFQCSVELQAHTACSFCVIEPNFDPKALHAGNNIALWEQQVEYINLLLDQHLNTYCSITIWKFMGNMRQSHLIWKDLVQNYKPLPFSYDHMTLYGLVLHQL